jgi:hypothetical protein
MADRAPVNAMSAFRFFDPWAALDGTDRPSAPAKFANPAKDELRPPETLATLAALAAAPGQIADSTRRDIEEERAAIVEYDGKIPLDWAEGFARLDPGRPPGDVPLTRWQRFVDDVGRFLDGPFCAVAATLGWGPYELFGCDRDQPFARIEQHGLLWLLNGNKLVALSTGAAGIETSSGERRAYRRNPSGPGRVLAWELP